MLWEFINDLRKDFDKRPQWQKDYQNRKKDLMKETGLQEEELYKVVKALVKYKMIQ